MSRLDRLEENLVTVKAFAAKCAGRYTAALADVHEAETRLTCAREAYAAEPSDSKAKAITKAREGVELAQLRATKPEQGLQDARASVAAAETALAAAQAEEQLAVRAAALARLLTAVDSLNDRLAPQWSALLGAYEIMAQAARAIDREYSETQAACTALQLEGIDSLGASPARIWEEPVTRAYQQSNPRGLVDDSPLGSGICLPGFRCAPTAVLQLVANAVLDFLTTKGEPAPSAEQRRVRDYFARGGRNVEAKPAYVPPPHKNGMVCTSIRDANGLMHDIELEGWSDSTKRVPQALTKQANRAVASGGPDLAFAEAILALPEVMPLAQ